MTLCSPKTKLSVQTTSVSLHRGIHHLSFAVALCWTLVCAGQGKPTANPAPDVLVLVHGDTLHGKLVNAIQGTVTFHTEDLGDVSLGWDKIKELHTSGKFAALTKNLKLHGRRNAGQIPIGMVQMENQSVVLRPENAPAPAPIPTENALYILDAATLNKQINHQPNLLTGWNGSATAGATLVSATQNEYAVSGAFGLVRVVPTVRWLNPRNRTSLDFIGSYGKITQPSYFAAGVFVPEVTTKTAIYHADAERDEYLSPRVYALAQVAFDHNYAQNLDLQQIYGGGFGWTFLKTRTQTADVKATLQYERQQFISGLSGTERNLIGSTFAVDYVLHMKVLTYTQGLSYIPAYNDTHAYSANETNTIAFPAYKNFGFSFGTIDTYLNGPPISLPPTKRNSFQFTTGLTYALKSKY
jgi:uncharacterized protein DUF481